MPNVIKSRENNIPNIPTAILSVNMRATKIVIKNTNPMITDKIPETRNSIDFLIEVCFLVRNAKHMNTIPIIVNIIRERPEMKNIIMNKTTAVKADPDIPKTPPTFVTTGSGLSIPVIDGGRIVVIICDNTIPIITI